MVASNKATSFFKKAPTVPVPEEKAPKDNPLFDQLRNLWTKRTVVSTKTKADSTYMLNRFLSLTPEGFLAAYDLNSMGNLPSWVGLPFLYYSVPQMEAPWKKYPKVPAEKLAPKKQLALDRVCARFCVKELHGKQIVAILQEQGIILEAN